MVEPVKSGVFCQRVMRPTTTRVLKLCVPGWTQEAKRWPAKTVSDFVRRLEKTFHRAYRHDAMLPETRNALPYAQLQEGLKYDLMEAPAVWSVGLYVAAKSEERRLAGHGLQKQKQYQLSQQRGFKKASPATRPCGGQPTQAVGRP